MIKPDERKNKDSKTKGRKSIIKQSKLTQFAIELVLDKEDPLFMDLPEFNVLEMIRDDIEMEERQVNFEIDGRLMDFIDLPGCHGYRKEVR